MLASLALGAAKWFLGLAERRADARTERARIEAGIDVKRIEGQVEVSRVAGAVVQSAMQFRVFWIPWLVATFPLSMWFAWGMLDSLILDGAVLPDVAALPPQIKQYADIAWSNLFYTGGGVAGIQMLARAIERRR